MQVHAMTQSTPTSNAELQDMANAIRILSMDAVQKANSGHPGMPMGMADVATVLFTKFLKYNPNHPNWPDRDRFVLSAGHGSMLLYSLLYLTGYEGMGLEDLKSFRQWASKTAGHPEYGHAPGIETTTGPLGQGLANAVGMALGEKIMKARFGDNLVNHKVYAIVGDGCLMEGISHEAISFAGHLGLDNLIVLFDDNSISIDGSTDLSVSDDQLARFKACGWQVMGADGHDFQAIEQALSVAQGATKPVLIACKTTIGKGAPNKQGTASTHGAPLGEEEIAAARKELGWTGEAFEIPDTLLDRWRSAGLGSTESYEAWKARHITHSRKNEFDRQISGDLPTGWDKDLKQLIVSWVEEQPALATRQSSQKVLDALSPCVPEMVGGSADLTGSNNTKAANMSPITPGNYEGSYIYYGVREHAMGAIMNGLALHGGVIPYGGTFLVFTDYLRPALRLSALMEQRVIYVMTHDSIGLGEDGPTHQPIEHLASLRAMPNVNVMRPADAIETAECWELALKSKSTPTVLALTRQKLEAIRLQPSKDNLCQKGAYLVSPAESKAQVTLIATGSEVQIALETQDLLKTKGIFANVVSMPCWELFEQQSHNYKRDLLGPNTLKVAIEAASPFGWERYVGNDGLIIGLDHFGASAPYQDLYENFGLTASRVVEKIEKKLEGGSIT